MTDWEKLAFFAALGMGMLLLLIVYYLSIISDRLRDIARQIGRSNELAYEKDKNLHDNINRF